MTHPSHLISRPAALFGGPETPVTAEHIAEITGVVWSSFLELTLEPTGSSDAPTGHVATGMVGITGAWQGSVVVSCSSGHATAAAEAMFAAEPGTLAEEEVADALGELTNMVGGNIKSLLPELSSLSTPSVTGGNDHHLFVPGARPILAVGMRCDDELVLVTLWQA